MQHKRSCPVRDTIMQRYDQELLGAPFWCTTQQEGLWIQRVNAMVPQRRVFVCALELVLDESLSHHHMGAVYHRGRSPSMVRVTGELDYFSAHIRLREPDKLEDKVVKRGEEATTSPEGLSYLKSKASIRKEMDSEERHSAAETDLPITKEGTQMQDNK
ncbi:hypothetical protein BHM03_00022177 [Ensete ventricosum]|nr:hypothetical protein BHM03_00022177 [Ensete ventricosum]